MSIHPPFLKYSYFKIWPRKSKINVKVKVQSRIVGPISYWCTTFRSMSVNPPILEIWLFQFWHWKFNIKVMCAAKVQGNIMGLTSYRLTSLLFHANWPSRAWCMVISKLDHGNPRSGSWVRSKFNVTYRGVQHTITHIPFVACQSTLPLLRYSYCKPWPWKCKVKVMGKVKVQGHTLAPTSYLFKSLLFQANWPCHSWDTTISFYFTVRKWVQHSIDLHSICFRSICHPIP